MTVQLEEQNLGKILRALSLGIKWPDHEADHSPASSAEVTAWSCNSTSPVHLHGMVCS